MAPSSSLLLLVIRQAGETVLSVRELCAQTGLSRRSVYYALGRLEAAGRLTIRRSPGRPSSFSEQGVQNLHGCRICTGAEFAPVQDLHPPVVLALTVADSKSRSLTVESEGEEGQNGYSGAETADGAAPLSPPPPSPLPSPRSPLSPLSSPQTPLLSPLLPPISPLSSSLPSPPLSGEHHPPTPLRGDATGSANGADRRRAPRRESRQPDLVEAAPAETRAKRTRRKTAPAEPSPAARVWRQYAEAYVQVYGVEPVRNARINAQCAQLVARLGVDAAVGISGWFLRHRASWYVRQRHSMGSLLKDCEKLHTEWVTNTRLHERDVHEIDRLSANQAMYERILARVEASMAENQLKGGGE